MNKRHPIKSGVLITAIIAGISAPFFVSAEQSPIPVESAGESSRDARGSTGVTYRRPIEESSPNSAMENQYQLQLLQEEVMQLRGQVEQLQYELGRMKSIADDRYLELDARLQQALKAQPPATTGQPVQDAAVTTSSVDQVDENLSEEELYDTTQLLIRNRQYDLAITQLESLIARFPDGEYTPNAYYWLGQVYAAKANPDFEKARQALAQVISYFPDHGKVPDAAFALGKVYHALGDCERAQDLLQQVAEQYQGKSAAKLAENYLRESVTCDP